MDALELKVPPPIVALVVALAMWVVSRLTTTYDGDAPLPIAVAVAVAVVGVTISTAGITSFRRAGTTSDPRKPDAVSSLVTSGIYRITRNPMYLGVLFVLVGWAAFLSAPWSLLGPVVLVVYLTRFQIKPEERALMGRFGDEYARYMARVRRWL